VEEASGVAEGNAFNMHWLSWGSSAVGLGSTFIWQVSNGLGASAEPYCRICLGIPYGARSVRLGVVTFRFQA
jgi:hypothetical protein